MSNFVKLGELAELTVGYVGPMEKEYINNGIPFLRSLNIKPFSIINKDIKYISKKFNQSIKKSIIHENDVVIVRTGMPGTCAVVPKSFDGCNCSDLVIVRPNIKIINPYYLCYFINSQGYKQIDNSKVGAVQKHFNVTSAKEMLIPVLPLDYQNTIASLLKTIDEKISNNNAIASNLEAMAKLIYDYWFVQFDFPDENGRPYKSSGGKMVWNDELKREIPEGWENGILGDVLTKYSISIEPSKIGTLPYTPMDTLPCRKMSFSEVGNQNDANSSLLKYSKFSILFGAMRPYFHRVCIAPFDGITRSTVFTLKEKRNDELAYAYETLNQNYVVNYANIHHVGTQQPYAEWENNLEKCPIALPPHELCVKFSKKISNIIHLVIDINLENQQLSSLRDFLLPMLMNGQVKIQDKQEPKELYHV